MHGWHSVRVQANGGHNGASRYARGTQFRVPERPPTWRLILSAYGRPTNRSARSGVADPRGVIERERCDGERPAVARD